MVANPGMDVIISIIIVVVVLLSYLFGQSFFRFCLYYRRFFKMPGSNICPFVGIPYRFVMLPKEDHMDVAGQIAIECKGFVAATILFHGFVGLAKPQYVEVVLRSNDLMSKSLLYTPLAPWVGQGLLMSTGPKYFHDRKLISQAFHYSIFDKFTDVMIEKVTIFNGCIERKIITQGEKPFDIFEMALKCALDIICETAMGVNIHAQEGICSEYMNAVDTVTKIAFERIFRPWLFPDWIFYRTSMGKTFVDALKTTNDFINHIITKKREERKLSITISDDKSSDEEKISKKKAFLDLLLEVCEKEDDPLTNEELRDHTNTFMFAGHDTTGALVGWAIFCLGNELDVQKKLHEELDEVLGDSDDQTTLKLLPNLKYLERVIKEVLRLYPSVPIVSRRAEKDIQIGEYTIPKDTSLNAYIYELHRDPEVWPDPLRFDPDRFLPENVKERHPYAYVPFSSGPRNCLGQKFAMLEAKLTLAKVMKNFRVKSIENHSVKKYCAIILKPIGGLYVNMTKRSTIAKE